MSRPRGGYIGHNAAPAASGANSAASGVWTLREAEALKRAGTWPRAGEVPKQISGLQLWLDASAAETLYDATTGGSLVAADGGVARWEDKSGNGRHATQGTSANRPARKTAIQGGKDVLRFDGSNDSLSIPSSTATFKFLHDGTNCTLFFVARFGDTADPAVQYALLYTGGGSGDEIGYLVGFEDRVSANTNNGFVSSAIMSANGSRAWLNRVSDTITPNTFVVFSEQIDGDNATASQRSRVRINGGAENAQNAQTNAPSAANSQYNMTIGAFNIGQALTSFLLGDIAEIIIYNSALSDANRVSVENYLLAKWGIT